MRQQIIKKEIDFAQFVRKYDLIESLEYLMRAIRHYSEFDNKPLSNSEIRIARNHFSRDGLFVSVGIE